MTPKRLVGWCGWAILVLLILPLYLQMAFANPLNYVQGGIGGYDFKAYYVAARVLGQGGDIYNPERAGDEMAKLGLPRDAIVYMYPSLLAILLQPITRLSLENAARLWNGVNLVWLAGALYLVTAALDLRRVLKEYLPWFFILFLVSAPVTDALRLGQANLLLLFLLALALFADVRRKDTLGGVAVGLATMLKIFPGVILIWWLAQRRWRAAVAGFGTIGGCFLLSALFLRLAGQDVTTDLRYLLIVFPNLVPPVPSENQSVAGLLSHFDLPVMWARWGTLLGSAAVVAVTLVALWRGRKTKVDGLGLSILISALLLVSTFTWNHTAVLLLIPFAVMVKAWSLQGSPRIPLLVFAVLYVCLSAGHWWGSPTYTPMLLAWVLSLGTFGIAGLWVYTVYESLTLKPAHA